MTEALPLNFQLGPINVTGFGITMMLAFLVGGWLVEREVRRRGFASDYSGDIVMGALIGGIVGAKLWFVALHGIDSLFSRSGLVYYGGFVGGALGVILNGWRRRVPIRWTAHLVAPALAAAYAVGRVGCYVVGDDYGRPTALPWAVAFPEGSPRTFAGVLREQFGVSIPADVPDTALLAVHPTQLYEVGAMLLVFALLWRWRTRLLGTGWLFGAYLVFAGVERFLVEILRAKDDRFVAGLTLAQLTSIALVVIGATVWSRLASAAPIPPGAWLQHGAGSPQTSP